MTPAVIELTGRLAEPLLKWFRASRRELPWRETRDPYRIWVSEIMLQQTQVETVLGYYARFLERFPTVSALAEADEDTVLAAWSGLGYYRRARLLHRAAQEVAAEHAGRLPSELADLLKLPGFGRYTAGAVLSIAHDARVPILDGNVIRVLSRIFRVEGDPSRGPANKELWRLAEAVLPSEDCGDFNQSLMELGALVCRPLNPACSDCPLGPTQAGHCPTGATGDWQRFPTPVPKTKVKTVKRVALLLTRGRGRGDGSRGEPYLMVQRPRAGLLAAMWELPALDKKPRERGLTAARRLAAELGLEQPELTPGAPASHRFSHRLWQVETFRGRAPRGYRPPPALAEANPRWTRDGDLPELALPTASRTILAAARAEPEA